MTAQSKMTAARTSLVLENPFFGTLALSLSMKADDTCQTAWIDGRTLGYNPTFIESLTHDQVTALVAHEIMHCALGHPWRRDGRNSQAWNVSCDKAINHDLQASGFTLPDGALYPSGEEQGKSAEWIFARINQQNKPDPNGQGQNKPDPLGELRDAPNGPDADGEPAPSKQEWKQKAASAMQQAKMAGKMPGGLQRSVQSALKTKVDLRSLLLRFFSERTNSDYTWSRPNARYIPCGLYLPALESRELGEIAIGIDTSGSVNEISLQYARAIVESVFDELSPAAVSVFYFDTEVSHIDRFSRGESLTWQPRGGGGTDFSPVLSAIENEGTAVCAVIITDLQGPFPASCDVPTIWLSTEEGTAPLGETVLIDR